MKSVKQTKSLLLIWLQIAIASRIIFSGKVSTSSVDSSAKIGDHFEFDSDSDEEILVKPELFSMTEANLCSILIDRFNFPANGSDNESTNVFTKTSIFGGKNEPFVPPIDEHILSELENVINNKKGQGNRQEIVFDYCIGKANGGNLEYSERLVKIVRLKLSTNTEHRRRFDEICLATRRHQPDSDRWEQTTEKLVAVLGARTLLLQFLSLSTHAPISTSKPAKSLDFFGYVTLLKRLDLGAKILFKGLEQKEKIPLKSCTFYGKQLSFLPEFDPFISFGLWQEHLVEFNENIDPLGKWWLFDDKAREGSAELSGEHAVQMLSAVYRFIEINEVRSRSEFFDFCHHYDGQDQKSERICDRFATIISRNFSMFMISTNVLTQKLYWQRIGPSPAENWPFPALLFLNDSAEQALKTLLVSSLALKLVELLKQHEGGNTEDIFQQINAVNNSKTTSKKISDLVRNWPFHRSKNIESEMLENSLADVMEKRKTVVNQYLSMKKLNANSMKKLLEYLSDSLQFNDIKIHSTMEMFTKKGEEKNAVKRVKKQRKGLKKLFANNAETETDERIANSVAKELEGLIIAQVDIDMSSNGPKHVNNASICSENLEKSDDSFLNKTTMLKGKELEVGPIGEKTKQLDQSTIERKSDCELANDKQKQMVAIEDVAKLNKPRTSKKLNKSNAISPKLISTYHFPSNAFTLTQAQVCAIHLSNFLRHIIESANSNDLPGENMEIGYWNSNPSESSADFDQEKILSQLSVETVEKAGKSQTIRNDRNYLRNMTLISVFQEAHQILTKCLDGIDEKFGFNHTELKELIKTMFNSLLKNYGEINNECLLNFTSKISAEKQKPQSGVQYLGLGMLYAVGRLLILQVLKHRDQANKILDSQKVDSGEICLNTNKLLGHLKQFETGIRASVQIYHKSFYSAGEVQLTDEAHLSRMQVIMDKLIASVRPFVRVKPAHKFEDTALWEKKWYFNRKYVSPFTPSEMVILCYEIACRRYEDRSALINFPERACTASSDEELQRREEFRNGQGTVGEKFEALLSPLYDQVLVFYNVKLSEHSAFPGVCTNGECFGQLPIMNEGMEQSIKCLLANLWLFNWHLSTRAPSAFGHMLRKNKCTINFNKLNQFVKSLGLAKQQNWGAHSVFNRIIAKIQMDREALTALETRFGNNILKQIVNALSVLGPISAEIDKLAGRDEQNKAHAQQTVLSALNNTGSKLVFACFVDVANDCIMALHTFFSSGIYRLREHEPAISAKDFWNFVKTEKETDDNPFENHFLIVAYKLLCNTLGKAPKPPGYHNVEDMLLLSPFFVPLIIKVRAFEESLKNSGINEAIIGQARVHAERMSFYCFGRELVAMFIAWFKVNPASVQNKLWDWYYIEALKLFENGTKESFVKLSTALHQNDNDRTSASALLPQIARLLNGISEQIDSSLAVENMPQISTKRLLYKERLDIELSELQFKADDIVQVFAHLNSLLGAANSLSSSPQSEVFPFPWPEDVIEHKNRLGMSNFIRKRNWSLNDKLIVLVADEVDQLIAEINFIIYSQKNASSSKKLEGNTKNVSNNKNGEIDQQNDQHSSAHFEHDELFARFLNDTEERVIRQYAFFNLGLSLVQCCLDHFGRGTQPTSQELKHFHEISENFSTEIGRLLKRLYKFPRINSTSPEFLVKFVDIGKLNGEHKQYTNSIPNCNYVSVDDCREAIESYRMENELKDFIMNELIVSRQNKS